MKQYSSRLAFIIIFSLSGILCNSQSTGNPVVNVQKEENFRSIGNLAPYSSGGYGFDTRYAGVKGTPMLYDTLLPSQLLLTGDSSYLHLNADIDLVENVVVFRHPTTGQLLMVPASLVRELIINSGGRELVFRTTAGKVFEKGLKEVHFIQVLNESPVQFVRMPLRTFVKANYEGAYSPDKRYDEYVSSEKYFVTGTDNMFYQIQLNKRSLLRIYPGKKSVIQSEEDGKSDDERESMIISILRKF